MHARIHHRISQVFHWENSFNLFLLYCCKGVGIMSYVPYEKELRTARATGTETIHKWLVHTAAWQAWENAQGYMFHHQLHSQLQPESLKKQRENSSYFGKGVVAAVFDSWEMVEEPSSMMLSRDFMLIQGWWQQLWYAACYCCFIILAYEALKALISVTDLSSTCSARICSPCSHCVLQRFCVGCHTNH
jgi:hypothetical protein